MSIESGILDCVVYAPDETPPLACLAGFPYFVLTVASIQAGHFVFLNNDMGFAGCLLYALTYILGKNVRTLRANGFSDRYTLQMMLFNLLSNVLMTWLVFQKFCGPDAVNATLDFASYSVFTVAAIAANLAMTEVVFYFAHKCLHEVLPHLHLMHHCVFAPTHSSNFIFNPIDFAFELGLPTVALFVNHFGLWQQDHTVLLVSYMFIQTFYALDHSDFLKLYHFHHHARLDDVYTVYIKYRNPTNAKREAVRKIIKRSTKVA
ncbi:hypothetical protein SPRG_15898 [Saprolegnia parasitica CBS 223.65]|uniref:Fatty acid hydroxylase domain-containing protein n=1 Tax=Saprolegnia parasitica (strain CBS 223.65) TaxID=695850 RepID=A0A067BJW7_SAPPC|nr:hypothetical protein SPRG_15898 [Saprolegnia parasitica CBS 223.65]KDO18729.1 hypothetical protein SPRG_15898 [Saprolegnia parasitica CBS 223.65]|eukprot:XP_012210555.1 hypothetical protein SPRG_15898 [Saprolegnia parasitica CBS 223.65]